jgi:hypothetical protein
LPIAIIKPAVTKGKRASFTHGIVRIFTYDRRRIERPTGTIMTDR